MTAEPPFTEHGGASGGGPPNRIAPVRAFLVLVVFIVAAVVLVAVGTRPSVSGDTLPAASTSTTTTTTHHGTTAPTTTTTTVPHSSVSVVVANATETNALAAHYSSILGAQGWAMQTPVDASTTEATSSVYYATGQQEPAAAIATTLGIKPTAVMPLTTSVPVAGASGDDVVVVIGSDLVPASGG